MPAHFHIYYKGSNRLLVTFKLWVFIEICIGI